MSETVPVRDLLDDGVCTPSCLLARNEEADGCRCRCGGEYHAALAAAEVPASEWIGEPGRCSDCKVSFRTGRLFFKMKAGLTCARCVERRDLYDEIAA